MAALEIRLEATRVGWLEYFEDDENYRFSFDPKWLADAHRPVLGQLFEDRRPNDIITSGMPCWFAHLLPQGPLRRFLAGEIGVAEDDHFAILGACEDDLPGALIVVPTEGRVHARAPDHPEPAAYDHARPEFAFSLAGAQWKLSIRQGERGLVIPTRGQTGQWIAKFHDPQFADLPRVEYSATKFADLCGLSVPHVRLGRIEEFVHLPDGIPLGDGSVYLTRRFDRQLGGRVHMEDFGQILDRPPGDRQYQASYEDIGAVIKHLAPEDIDRYIEQLLFCILIGNGDAHLKNWSLFYPDRRNPRLSPAYDLVPTIIYQPRDDLALSLADRRNFADLDAASFDPLARAIDREAISFRQQIARVSDRIRETWQQEGAHLDFNERERERITKHMDGLRLESR